VSDRDYDSEDAYDYGYDYAPREQKYIYISFAEIVAATAKAVLLCLDDGEEDVWLPRSQIKNGSRYHKGERHGGMWITEWIAIQKGLIE